ncbi:MAG TPA: hypothetical protein VNM40_01620 [Candidatus Paceibacterota bacterium]|nr:hypothetical protein [Candidatus Paceibacterota bacterium]
MNEQKFIRELLGDEFAQTVIRECGLEDDPPEAQVQFITLLGENIIQRISLEILKALPESEIPKFESFIGSGDMDGLRTFLLPHVPDLDRFIQHEAMKEYEATKTRMHEIIQGQ